MTDNLLRDSWTDLDSAELRLFLDKRVGGPGQYHDRSDNPNKLYLPLAGSSCRIVFTFRQKKIVTIEPGQAFDASEWERVSEEIEKSILMGPLKVGREYSFSSFRVPGSWRGERSDVQILPPPDDAPRAHIGIAEHPFILEFPIRASDFEPVTNHRRIREHRNLTLLLNVLIAGRTSLQPQRSQYFWASVPREDGHYESIWAQQFFFGKLGSAVIDKLSPPTNEQLAEVDPEEYYTKVGHDGKGLRVPADLDQSICLYLEFSPGNRDKFSRAGFWMDMASRQWTVSFSASFASLVIAVEALGERDLKPTERFRNFIEQYAPGASLESRRKEMYALRSDILHGSGLMEMDQDAHFGWAPPEQKERDLMDELWGLTRIAVRNWLKNPPPT